MTRSLYIEDIFLTFFALCIKHTQLLQSSDWNVCQSFEDKISSGYHLTENQGKFILKLLSKYKDASYKLGLDYNDTLTSPIWKNSFRTIDLSKQIFVEEENNEINVCLRFPYSIKAAFEKEIDNDRANQHSRWDHERKLRILNLYHYNIIQLYDFCLKHGFDIDDSFMSVVGTVEEIWQNQEHIFHTSIVSGNNVSLVNATESAEEYWNLNKTDSVEVNMFLAKSMGYPTKVQSPKNTLVEKITSSSERAFWIKSFDSFFEIYKNLNGVACILLDRNTKDVLVWLQSFLNSADKFVNRTDVKICFRETDSNSKLNTWVKENNVGGKVEDGKVLIFLHKPPKWLFTKEIDVKIIATNSYTPHNEPIASSWISAHPCVCYVSDIKPTLYRNKKIVEL